MICFTESGHPSFEEIKGHPCLAAMIGCMAACGEPRDDFWLLLDDAGQVGAWLCRTGDCLYTTGSPIYGEEISAFVNLMGFGCVETDIPLTLTGAQKSTNVAMQWQGLSDRAIFTEGTLTSTQGREEVPIAELTGLLHRIHMLPDRDAAGEMAVILLHRIREGRAAALMLREERRVQAVAAITHIGCGFAMIGGVAVSPEYRYQGLGSRIAAATAKLAVEQGYLPLLACNERRVSFYTRIGFTPIIPFYRYERTN